MSLYTRLAATSLRLLTKYGQSVTLRKYTTGAYDPTTGAGANTITDTTRKAALFDYNRMGYGQTLQGSTLVQQGDKQCLMDANGAAPTLADHIIIGTVEYVIKDIKEVNPAGTPMLYDLLVRS